MSRSHTLACTAPLAFILACGTDGGEGGSAQGTDDSSGTSATATVGTESSAATGSSESGETDSGDPSSSSSGPPPVGEPPQAVDDVYYAVQDGDPVVVAGDGGLLSNDVDPEAGAITVENADTVSQGGGQVEVGSDGSLNYVPSAGFWGTDTFDYSIVDPDGNTDDATVTVYVAPVVVPLEEVAGGHNGFVMEGEHDSSWAGSAVAGAGDVDGDGLADLIVGAHWYDGMRGRAYVVHGRSGTTAIELSDVAANDGGFALAGADTDYLGGSVDGVGDFDGDGLDDVIVGATSGGSASEGRAYVVFGRADGASPTADGLEMGVGGLVVRGDPTQDRFLGTSVAGVGDVNGDGLADIAVAAVRESSGLPNRSFVIFGRADTTAVDVGALDPSDGFAILSDEVFNAYTRTAAPAGDVDGDGLADVVVASSSDYPDEGGFYVVYGKTDGGAVDLANLGDLGFSVLPPPGSADFFAFDASGVGDFNGDGLSDIFATWNTSLVVVFGRTGGGQLFVDELEADAAGVLFDYESPNGMLTSVASAGDINGDGLADAIAGPGWGSRAYVIFGRTDVTSMNLSTIASGDGGFVLDGEYVEADPGWAVGGAGDVDGDGLDDIVIGNYYAPNASERGQAHVVFSVPRAPR